MPAQVDEDMLRTTMSGEPWRGLVKYRRKNGGYFWCIANVTPVIEKNRTTGFMAVCTKPKPQQVKDAEALYRTVKGPK